MIPAEAVEAAARAALRARQCRILSVVMTVTSLALYAVGGEQALRGELLPCLIFSALGAASQIQALATAKAGERWSAIRGRP